MVERLPVKERVVGSNPTRGAFRIGSNDLSASSFLKKRVEIAFRCVYATTVHQCSTYVPLGVFPYGIDSVITVSRPPASG